MKTKEYEKKTKDFVADETMFEDETPVITEPEQKVTKIVNRPKPYIVTVPNLALRIGPGTNYDKIGIAPSGHVLIDETKDGFGRLADGSGWICLEYARKVD